MPTIAAGGRHNVAVMPLRGARTTLIAALLAPALVLSGCGGANKDKPSAKPSTDLPKGNVAVPAGVTLTKAGTALQFGQPALVAYEPNTQRSSVLSLTVDSVTLGSIRDFGAYQLNARAKSSRPYYARFTVKNVGTGDLSGMAVPLFAVSNSNALVQPSSFNNAFRTCPSKPLPVGFGAGKSYRGCLVYMIPDKGTLEAMSYRPLQAFEPITWKGTILPTAQAQKAAKNKAAAKQKAAKKKKASS
jgi:hypothetical protein